jgi:hypothetical protein
MQADPEQLPAFPSVRSDQGGIKMTGKRAPWLNTRQDRSAATIGCFQPVRGGFGGEYPPGPIRHRGTGFREDGQRIAVRFQNPGNCEVPLTDRRKHRPA